MKHNIYPCIWFDNQGKEAATFYCEVFHDTEIKSSMPMVTMFSIKGKSFMALDGGPTFRPNPAISFFVICQTEAEINHAWAKLSEGGQALMPLNTYPWSKKYGWIQDKYGVSWQLSLGLSGQDKADVFPALMFTGNQNGNAEKAINFYTSLFENSSVDLISRYEPGDGDIAGHIKHAQFTINGYRMAAMDSAFPHRFNFNEGVSIVVNCDTQKEIDFYWLNLTDGGKESMCGWCQDAFGVWWQIVPAILLEQWMSDPKTAPKVMEAFMKMKKFDIETLRKAAMDN